MFQKLITILKRRLSIYEKEENSCSPVSIVYERLQVKKEIISDLIEDIEKIFL